MVIKEYPDGSQFTAKHMAASMAIGAVATAAWIGVMNWKEKRIEKKYQKKYSEPIKF